MFFIINIKQTISILVLSVAEEENVTEGFARIKPVTVQLCFQVGESVFLHICNSGPPTLCPVSESARRRMQPQVCDSSQQQVISMPLKHGRNDSNNATIAAICCMLSVFWDHGQVLPVLYIT